MSSVITPNTEQFNGLADTIASTNDIQLHSSDEIKVEFKEENAVISSNDENEIANESTDNSSQSSLDTSMDQEMNIILEHEILAPIREMIFRTSNGTLNIDDIMNELQRIIRECYAAQQVHKSRNQRATDPQTSSSIAIEHQHSIFNSELMLRTICNFLSLYLPQSWIDPMCKWMSERMEVSSSKFLNFQQYYASYFHADENQSHLFILQSALHRRFPLLMSEGCASLARAPVFYGTKQSNLFRNNENCLRMSWQLLQTGASFKIIPLSKYILRKKGKNTDEKVETEETEKNFCGLRMDLRSLEQEIERDQSKGRLPCIVFASYLDNLHRLRQICNLHGLWLHIEGGYGGEFSFLLNAASNKPKLTKVMMKYADSISCQPLKWFYLHYYRNENNDNDRNYNQYMQTVNVHNITDRYHYNDGQQYYQTQTQQISPSATTATADTNSTVNGSSVVDDNGVTLTFVKQDLRDTAPPAKKYSHSDFISMFIVWHLFCTNTNESESEHPSPSVNRIQLRINHALNICQFLKNELFKLRNIFHIFVGPLPMIPNIVLFQIYPKKTYLDLNQFRLDFNSYHELLLYKCHVSFEVLGIQYKIFNEESVFKFNPLLAFVDLYKNEDIFSLIGQIVVQTNILRKCLECREIFRHMIETSTVPINTRNVLQNTKNSVENVENDGNVENVEIEVDVEFEDKKIEIEDMVDDMDSKNSNSSLSLVAPEINTNTPSTEIVPEIVLDKPETDEKKDDITHEDDIQSLTDSYYSYNTINYDNELEYIDHTSIDPSTMVGIGAFRFVPSFLKHKIKSESIALLNKQLCDNLNEKHNGNGDSGTENLYKLAFDVRGIICIVIEANSIVFNAECVDIIYGDIIECKKEMQYPTEVLEEMSAAVVIGIENAKREVEKNRVMSSNYGSTAVYVVKHIPIVGRVYGWWVDDENEDGDNVNKELNGVEFQIGKGMINNALKTSPMNDD